MYVCYNGNPQYLGDVEMDASVQPDDIGTMGMVFKKEVFTQTQRHTHTHTHTHTHAGTMGMVFKKVAFSHEVSSFQKKNFFKKIILNSHVATPWTAHT